MLSPNTFLDAGKVILGMAVGVIAIFFNRNDKTEMKGKEQILGLRTTAYQVADIKAAKEWYANAFETEPYFDEDYYVGFSIGGYELGLFPGESDAQSRRENVLSYWGVEDIEKTYNYLLENGAVEGDAPRDVGDGIIVAHVFDPWENAIGIIYNPHFKLPESDTDDSVVEWAPFELREGVEDQELISVSNQLQKEFLEKQKGFVKRDLLKKGDGQWVDLVYWKSQQDADNALTNAERSPVCGTYFGLMKMDETVDPSAGVAHLDVVETY